MRYLWVTARLQQAQAWDLAASGAAASPGHVESVGNVWAQASESGDSPTAHAHTPAPTLPARPPHPRQLDVEVLRADAKEHVTITLEASS